MNEHVKQTIAGLQDDLRKQEQEVIETKRLINSLCKRNNLPQIYLDSDLTQSNRPSLSIQSDQFYGQPLAGSIRQILELRRAMKQGPATVNDLYDTLLAGGFKFETKNVDNAKRGLRISLMKNTATFHKLPNGMFGLLEWYPNAKAAKPKDNGGQEEDEEETIEESKP